MPSRLRLWMHATLAVVGLWSFYLLAFWTCLSALRHSDTSDGDVGLVLSAAGLALLTLALSAGIVPWLLDRLLRVEWIRLDEAGDVGPHLRDVLETWHLPSPYLGVVVDADPCAMTYGVTRRGARLIVTSGLLKSLDVDEQCAIVTHEAGHLASGDFRFATLFAGPLLILTQLRGMFDHNGGRFGLAAASPAGASLFTSGGFLTPMLGALVRIYTFFFAGFAQSREQWADAFACSAVSEAALQRAVLTMNEVLARPGPTRHALAVAARGFSPVDAWTAGRIGTAAAWDGVLDRERLAEMARVVEANPASELAQQTALHPPTAERIPGGTGVWAHVSTFTLARVFSAWLPAFGFIIGLCICLARGGWFGLPLVLWGIGRLIWLGLAFGRMHGSVDSEVALHDVLEKLAAEPTRAYRMRVDARIAGNGVPQQTWCPDLVAQVGELFVALRPRVVFGVFRAGIEDSVLAPRADEPLAIRGVLRMLDVPYLELHAVDAGDTSVWRSHYIALHILGSAVLMALGLLIMAPQWLGL